MIRTIINKPKTFQILMDKGVPSEIAKEIAKEIVKELERKNEIKCGQGFYVDCYTTDEMMALIPSPNQVIYNTDTNLLMVWTNDNPDSNKDYRWLRLELASDDINNKETK